MKVATPGASTGFDGGKRAKERKRHVLVDTLGLLLVVAATAANGDDRQGPKALLTKDYKRLPRNSESMTPVTPIPLLLKRLARRGFLNSL